MLGLHVRHEHLEREHSLKPLPVCGICPPPKSTVLSALVGEEAPSPQRLNVLGWVDIQGGSSVSQERRGGGWKEGLWEEVNKMGDSDWDVE